MTKFISERVIKNCKFKQDLPGSKSLIRILSVIAEQRLHEITTSAHN